MQMPNPIHYQNQYQPQDQYAMQQPQQDKNQQSYQPHDARMYNISTNRTVRFSDQGAQCTKEDNKTKDNHDFKGTQKGSRE